MLNAMNYVCFKSRFVSNSYSNGGVVAQPQTSTKIFSPSISVRLVFEIRMLEEAI
jgi:hypothetical protein